MPVTSMNLVIGALEQKVITCHLGSLLFCVWGNVDFRTGRIALVRRSFRCIPIRITAFR